MTNGRYELIDAFDEIYRNGHTYHKALIYIGKVVIPLLKKFDHIENDEYELYPKLLKTYGKRPLPWKIHDDFLDILDIWENEVRKEKKRTDSATRLLIKAIAKKLKVDGPFVDWATDTGSILADIDHDEIYGYDIDESMEQVARTLIYLQSKKGRILKNTSFKADSINKPGKSDGVIIFDPPMGDNRKYRFEDDEKAISQQILGSNYGNLSSELLFITRYLISGAEDSFFISLVPDSFLNRSKTEHNSLREYLIRNNLITVIRPVFGLLLLVGAKNKEFLKDREDIPIVRILNNFDYSHLDRLVNGCLENPDELSEITGIRAEIFKDRSKLNHDQLYIPAKPIPQKEVKSINEVKAELDVKMEEINSEFSNLSEILKTTTELVEEPEKEKYWFETTETAEAHIIKRLSDDGIITLDDSEDAEMTFDRSNSLKQIQNYLKQLMNSNIKTEIIENRILLKVTLEGLKEKKETPTKLSELLQCDKLFEQQLSLLSDFYREVYRDLIEFWLKEKKEGELLTNKVRNSEIIPALDCLEVLGLCHKIAPEEGEHIYNTYEPNIPTLYGETL